MNKYRNKIMSKTNINKTKFNKKNSFQILNKDNRITKINSESLIRNKVQRQMNKQIRLMSLKREVKLEVRKMQVCMENKQMKKIWNHMKMKKWTMTHNLEILFSIKCPIRKRRMQSKSSKTSTLKIISINSGKLSYKITKTKKKRNRSKRQVSWIDKQTDWNRKI